MPWIGRTLWMCAVTPRLVHDTLMLLSHEEALRLLARVHDATDVAPFIVPGPAAERSIGKITSLLQDWERAGALRMILR